MKNFRKHLSILLAAAMLFGSAQFTFAGGEDPLPEETLIEVASNIAAEEPEPESVKKSNSVSETAAQELMRVPMMRTLKSAPSSDAIRFGNLIVSGFEGTLEESGTPNLWKVGEEAVYTSGAAVTIDGYEVAENTLIINTPANKELTFHTDGTHTGAVILNGDMTLNLNSVDFKPTYGPGLLIKSPHEVTLNLENGSVNDFKGSNGKNINATAGSFAGIEVEFEFEEGESPANKKASLTIDGEGTLNAAGSENAAGIGGSNSKDGSVGRGLYGDITIEGGTIYATATGGGAGIGSSNNPNGGTSIGSFKAAGNNTWGTITIKGGSVTATASGSGAGIGGGNHVDSGTIVITGGTVIAHGASGIGCGIGSSKNSGGGADKGPGYYFADVSISGGNITASSNDIGAAIGGGMYCDAKIDISGGTIHATGGSRAGNTHHGGAGIGGGYLGHTEIEISGGNITAVGGDGAAGIGSGGSPNSTEARGINGRSTAEGIVACGYTEIKISGGTIDATGGLKGGAGIGLGVGGDKVSVSIEGGTVIAKGAASEKDEMRGGAGIGSGFQGAGSGNAKYFTDADVDISITGGDVTAIGGWGAAGIGSGAENKMANEITIDNEKANVVAFADGTKFAIDTRVVDTETGETSSKTEGRSFNGNMVQGTYVHTYEYLDKTQDTTNFENFDVIYQADESKKYSLSKPVGYRSFAVTVEDEGGYYIHTEGEEKIGGGEERFFAVGKLDTFDADYMPNDVTTKDIQYEAKEDQLCDNFYLFPVKSIIVVKGVQIQPQTDTSRYGKDLDQFETSLREDQTKDFLSNIDHDVYFSIKSKSTGEFVKNDKGEQWIEKVSVENGQPKGRAVFANIDDGTYDVWEVDKDGNGLSALSEHAKFDGYEIALISTVHASDPNNPTNNNGVLDEKTWVDYVTVNNWYRPTVTISGSKTWVDNDNAKNTRPESITIDLWADGNVVDSKTVTATDDWKWTFEGLVKKNQAGNDITYTVKEGEIPDYISEVSGCNVKNTYVDPSDPQIRIIAVRTTAEVKGTARMEDIDHSLLFTLQETRPNQQGGTDEPNQPAGTSSKASLRMASGSSGFEPKSLTFTDGVCGEYLIFTDIPEGKDFTAVEVDADGNPVKAGTRYPGGYRLESDPVCKEVEPFAVEGIPEGAAVTYLEVHNVYTASSGGSGGTDPTPTPDPVTPPVDPDPVDPPADPDPTDIPDDPTPQAGPTGGVDDGSDEYGGKDPDSGLEDMEDEDTPKMEYSPLTGDERHTAVWAGVSLASLAAILWLASRRRREE